MGEVMSEGLGFVIACVGASRSCTQSEAARSSAWIPATQEGERDGAADSWPQSCLTLVATGIHGEFPLEAKWDQA